jgi:molecular chaperone Hsp33
MSQDNIITAFTICDDQIKGKIVKLNQELDIILTQHQYPNVVAEILAELLMTASIIGSLFKNEITLTIQLETKGKLKYIVADYQSPGFIRGYAQIDNEDNDFSDESYNSIIDKGILSVTIDQKFNKNERYQGLIEVDNMSISQAIEKYFDQSEQIKTLLKLSVGKVTTQNNKEVWCAGGIMIQKLPSNDDKEIWNDARAYFMTIRDHELIDPSLTNDKLLYSLYHEVGIKTFDSYNISHKCRCSRERVEQVIVSLGAEEAISLLVDNKISIHCQFCNHEQELSETEIKKLFKQRI